MAETKNVYLILDIEEYGKFISYCIEHDISVWRTYWDEREKGNRCYQIDWDKKRCFYSSRKYYEACDGVDVMIPRFYVDEYGKYHIC